MFRGKELVGNERVAFYNIQNDSTIDLLWDTVRCKFFRFCKNEKPKEEMCQLVYLKLIEFFLAHRKFTAFIGFY